MAYTYFLESAYILHSRPYRDTSLLIDFFTREHGLIGAVARGVRGGKSPLKGILQPFSPLLISFSWKKELAVLTHAESNLSMHSLTSKSLFSAFYLNELLIKLLQRHDAHIQLYDYYHYALAGLSQEKNIEIPLRCFERQLLSELGYGLNLTTDAYSGKEISLESNYQFLPQKGFCEIASSHVAPVFDSVIDKGQSDHMLVDRKNGSSYAKINNYQASFSGKVLRALAAEDFSDATLLPEIKQLLRIAIADLLGYKPLKSRDLFTVLSNSIDRK